MSEDEYFLNDGDISDVDAEGGFEDGTKAIREFGRVVQDESKATGEARLRLRKQPELPLYVKNTSVVCSQDYFKHRDIDASSTIDSDSDEIISATDSDVESENDGKLSISNSLLEAQWKLEEESKRELQLIEKKDQKEREQLKIKAEHSKNQLQLWTQLIGVRIHLQKVLSSANRLPPPPAAELFKEATPQSDGSSIKDQCIKSIVKLLISLRRLQVSLIHNNREVSKSIISLPAEDQAPFHPIGSSIPFSEIRKRRRREFETLNGAAAETQAWNAIDRTPKKVISWALNVADQWSSKTSLKVQQTFKVLEQNPSAQVSRALRVDLERLLDKIRPTVTNSLYHEMRVLGVDLLDFPKDPSSGRLINPENYDDPEFYISMLKDTVQQNRNDSEMVSAASQIGALSVRLKKQEAEKKKKDFDRKGSNGRKIRYVPIPQLLGFMTAEPKDYGISSTSGIDRENDERLVNQLTASLFQDV